MKLRPMTNTMMKSGNGLTWYEPTNKERTTFFDTCLVCDEQKQYLHDNANLSDISDVIDKMYVYEIIKSVREIKEKNHLKFVLCYFGCEQRHTLFGKTDKQHYMSFIYQRVKYIIKLDDGANDTQNYNEHNLPIRDTYYGKINLDKMFDLIVKNAPQIPGYDKIVSIDSMFFGYVINKEILHKYTNGSQYQEENNNDVHHLVELHPVDDEHTEWRSNISEWYTQRSGNTELINEEPQLSEKEPQLSDGVVNDEEPELSEEDMIDEESLLSQEDMIDEEPHLSQEDMIDEEPLLSEEDMIDEVQIDIKDSLIESIEKHIIDYINNIKEVIENGFDEFILYQYEQKTERIVIKDRLTNKMIINMGNHNRIIHLEKISDDIDIDLENEIMDPTYIFLLIADIIENHIESPHFIPYIDRRGKKIWYQCSTNNKTPSRKEYDNDQINEALEAMDMLLDSSDIENTEDEPDHNDKTLQRWADDNNNQDEGFGLETPIHYYPREAINTTYFGDMSFDEPAFNS